MSEGSNGVHLSRPVAMAIGRGPSPMMHEIAPTLDEERLLSWMLEWTSPKKKAHQCCHFVLSCRSGKGPEVVDQTGFELGKHGLPDAERPDWCLKAIDLLHNAAKNWAEDKSEPTHFVIGCATTSELDAMMMAQFPFKIGPQMGALAGLNNEYGPRRGSNSEEVVTELRLLTEVSFKLLAQNTQTMLDRQADQIKDQNNLIKSMLDEQIEVAKRMQVALDEEQTRKIAMKREEMNLALQRAALMKALEIAAPALQSFLQKKGLGAGAVVQIAETAESGLMAFAKSLSPKQLIRFLSDLTPEQTAEFAPMAEQLIGQMSDEQKASMYSEAQKIAADRAEDKEGSK